MKFCNYLLRDINFEPTSIQPCCDVRSVGVPQFPFTGGALDVEAYKRHISNVFWSLQEHTEYCEGCPELIDADISFETEKDKNIGRFMRIQTVSFNQHRFYCNCRCVYCSLWNKQNKGPVYPVLHAVKSLVESGILDEQCYFSWGGGEPTILAEFDEVCAWVHSQGYFQNVHTSALRYSESVAAILAARAGTINISLDAASPATYAKIKGVKGWDKVLATLLRYLEAAITPQQIDLKYIIFEANNQLSEIAAFLDLSHKLGLESIQYSLDFREINKQTISQKTLLAAAFFRKRAQELGMETSPFFIDAPLLQKIEALEQSL